MLLGLANIELIALYRVAHSPQVANPLGKHDIPLPTEFSSVLILCNFLAGTAYAMVLRNTMHPNLKGHTMDAGTPTLHTSEATLASESPELSDFERQVQWSEFVPSPMRFLLMTGAPAIAGLAD